MNQNTQLTPFFVKVSARSGEVASRIVSQVILAPDADLAQDFAIFSLATDQSSLEWGEIDGAYEMGWEWAHEYYGAQEMTQEQLEVVSEFLKPITFNLEELIRDGGDWLEHNEEYKPNTSESQV
ncbi:TPA: hypothetical protein I7730_15835 [Vibrio vulnificus]|uniref:Uncharacterized protein n=1 Tax=Vibrio vulnificus TaxID=672 RepID=A0A8H9TGA3_VIBVL|nr:hypothetical protein [Vibrio vulnificus]HAS8541253.1 hypothetical protein [Vibrio vulnificus]